MIFVSYTAVYAEKNDTVAFIEYYANDSVATKGYKNKQNLKVGQWTWYYMNGKVQSTGEYSDKGWKTGIWQWFYRDGSLQ